MKDKKSPLGPETSLPDHESGVRRMVADARGEKYESLVSLEEAKALADGVVVFEGDDGGQIYMTCPASMVMCSSEALATLLRDLDALAWRDPESARVFFERHQIGSAIPGGMGGGHVTGELWLHKDFEKLKLRSNVLDVLACRRRRLR